MSQPDSKGAQEQFPQRGRHLFYLTLASLLVGAVLLVVGGRSSDTITQTAGASIVSAVIGALGYRSLSAKGIS